MNPGIILGLLSAFGAKNSIEAQSEQMTSQALGLIQASTAQAMSDLDLLSLREAQEADAITLEQVRRTRQGTRERGALASRLADSGVTGGSTVRDAVTSVIQELTDVSTWEHRKRTMRLQSTAEKQAAITRGKTGVASGQRMLEGAKVDPLAGFISVFSAGLEGYSRGSMLQPMPTTRRDKAGGQTNSQGQ